MRDVTKNVKTGASSRRASRTREQVEKTLDSRSVKTVGVYELQWRIATGGMAEVFLALPRQSDAPHDLVAVKLMRRELADDPAFLRMIKDEAMITALLQHPNIARLLDAGVHEEQPFLVIEFIAGASLYHLTKSGPASCEVVAEIGAGVARGLHAAHEQTDASGAPLGIIHRDVTPGNVMVSFAGEVKLLDFGIAKARVRAERTRPGILKGKWGYMSPEQIHGENIDRRIDIFSLGCVLLEMATGTPVFRGQSPMETLKLVINEDPFQRMPRARSLPAPLKTILSRCLEKDPEKRYQRASDVAHDLEAFAAGREEGPLHDKERLALYVAQTVPELLYQVTSTCEALFSGVLLPDSEEQSPDGTTIRSAVFEVQGVDIYEEQVDDVEERRRTSTSPTLVHPQILKESMEHDSVPPGVSQRALVLLTVILATLFGLGLAILVWFLGQ